MSTSEQPDPPTRFDQKEALRKFRNFGRNAAEAIRTLRLKGSRIDSEEVERIWNRLYHLAQAALKPREAEQFSDWDESRPAQRNMSLVTFVLDLCDRAAEWGETNPPPPPPPPEEDAPKTKIGGRPSLGEGPNATPQEKALRNVYEVIRGARKRGWGPQTLLDHFRDNKDFQERLKEAGQKPDKGFYKAAIAWIKENYDQETQSGNVS